jgi:hypothetical protein
VDALLQPEPGQAAEEHRFDFGAVDGETDIFGAATGP